jgi:hypothetical protein
MANVARWIPVAAAGALLAGCGGSGQARLSRSEFTSRANAICTRFEEVLKPTGSSKAESPPTFARRLGAAEKPAGELKGLRPPASEQKAFDLFLADLDHLFATGPRLYSHFYPLTKRYFALATNVGRHPAKPSAAERAELRRLSQQIGVYALPLQRLSKDYDRHARALGLTRCVSRSS